MKKPETKLNLSTLALLAATPGLAMAGPQGGKVAAGDATINQATTQATVITQSSAKAIINWQSFSIGADEYVQFKQPDSNSISLNRVVGSDPSSILGNLSANGQVFLVNPNGVFFAAGATLDVGGLVASSLDIDDDDFLNGNYVFTKSAALESKSVINAGVIQARENGYVVLMGERVENSGSIKTRLGQIALLAGGEVSLDLNGDGLVSYSIDANAATELAGVKNSGDLIADGGRVILAGKVSDALVATAVNNTGLVQANGIEERNGEIYLTGNADVYNSGSIRASGESGGHISIQGKRVAQQGNVYADGTIADGGVIAINADEVIALTDASLTTANAGTTGKGGEVIVYTTGSSIFNYGARIEAKGGSASGDGGFVEVSGIEHVVIKGVVDASATDGVAGTFLIDPTDINIVASDTSVADVVSGGGDPDIFTTNTDDANEILNTTIETLLNAGTSVTLQTTNAMNADDGGGAGDITVDAAINTVVDDGMGDTDATLTLIADNDILLNQDITNSTGTLNVDLQADGNISFNTGADITTNGGVVTITADADGGTSNETISMASDSIINAGAASISLNADGDIALGQLSTSGAVNVVSGNGAITDANAATNNITGSTVTITSDSGIGSGDAIETAATALDLSVLGTGNIEIEQTGNVDLAGIDTADGSLAIIAAGTVTTSNDIVATDGDVSLSTTTASNGSITLSNNVTATTSANGSDVSLGITAGGSGVLTQNAMTTITADANGDDANATLSLAGGTIALNGSSVVEIKGTKDTSIEEAQLTISADAGGLTTSGSLLADVKDDGNANITITSSGSSSIGQTATANVTNDGDASISVDSTASTIINAAILAEAGGPNSQGDATVTLDGDTAVDINSSVTAFVDKDGNAQVAIGGSGTVTVGAAVTSMVDGTGDASINIGTMASDVASATIEAAGSLVLIEGGSAASETLTIYATGAIETTGGSLDANDGITLSAGSVNAGSLSASTGTVSVTADTSNIVTTSITADSISISNTGTTNGDITTGQLDADNGGITLNAAGALSTGANTVTATAAIDIDAASVVAGNLDSSTGTVNVDTTSASIAVGTVDADSGITLNAVTSLDAGVMTITNTGDVSVTAGTTIGSAMSSFGNITGATNISFSAGGLVSTGSNVYSADQVTLSGTGVTGASYDIDTDTADLRLSGGIASAIVDNTAYSSPMTAAALSFSGSSFGTLDIDTNEDTTISGALSATGSVDINSGSGTLTLANALSATDGISLTSAAALSTAALTANNAAGATISLKGTSITAGDLTTDASTGTVVLDAPTSSAGAITTNTLTVKDGMTSATDLTLSGALSITNAAISVSGSLSLNDVNASTGITLAANDISSAALTTSAGNISVTASGNNMGVAVNTGAITANGTNATVTVSGVNGSVTTAAVSADSSVSLDGGASLNTGNITTNNAAVTLDATSVSAGAITASALTVQDGVGVAANDLTLSGTLTSGTGVSLTVDNALDVKDISAATGNIALVSSMSTVDSGSLTSTLGRVDVNANGQYTFVGDISAATGVSLIGNGIAGSSNGNVSTTSGNVSVTAASGDISVGNLTASAVGAAISVEATTGDATVGALDADTVSIVASSLTLNDTYSNGNFTATNTLTVNGTIDNDNINLMATDFILGSTGLLLADGAGGIVNITASNNITLDGTITAPTGTLTVNAGNNISGSGTSTANLVNLIAAANIGTDAANQLAVNAATSNVSGTISNAYLNLTATNSNLNINSALGNTLDIDAINLNLSGSGAVTAADINVTTTGNLSLGQSLNGSTSISLNVDGSASDGGNTLTTAALNLAGTGSFGTTLSPFNSNTSMIDIDEAVSSVVLDNAATALTTVNLSGGAVHGNLDISASSDVNLTAGVAITANNFSLDTSGSLNINQDVAVNSTNSLILQANGIDSNTNTLTADIINLTGTTASVIDVVTDAATVNLNSGIGAVTLDTSATAATNLNLNAAAYCNLTLVSNDLAINGTTVNVGDVAANAGAGDLTINTTLNTGSTVTLDTSGQLINNAAVNASGASSIVIGGITPVSAMSGSGQYRADNIVINASNPATVSAVTNTASLTVNGGANLIIDNNAFTGTTTFNYGKTNYTSLDLNFAGTTTLIGSDITTSGTTTINSQAGLNLNQAYSAPLINLSAGGQVNVAGTLTASTINLAGSGGANYASSAAKLMTNATNIDFATGINNIFLDNTANTGSATVNFSGSNYGIVDIDFGGISSKVATATTSTVQGNNFSASAFAVSANGNVVVANGFNVNSGTVPGVLGDTLLTSAVASVGDLINAGGSSDPNASFIVTDSLTLNISNLSQSNQYLLIKADDITFTGTSNAANLLVQLTPFSISQTDVLGNTTFASLSLNQSTAGTADFNYIFDNHFAPFTGTTIALGEQGFNGDITIGTLNAGSKDLLFLSGGTITGFNNIIGTGLLGTADEVGGLFVVRPIVTTVTADQLGSFGFKFGARVSTIELNGSFGGTGKDEKDNDDLELEEGGVNDGSEKQCS